MVTTAIVSVARNPDELPRPARHERWRATGVRHGMKIAVLLDSTGRIITGYTTGRAKPTRDGEQQP